MKLKIILTGKTELDYINQGWNDYFARIKRYAPIDLIVIPSLKNTKNIPIEQQKIAEGKLIQSQLSTTDYVILLDENGTLFSSENFSTFLQQRMNSGIKILAFVIGGPFGFSEEIYKRADFQLSMSKMTFTHQMIRLIFIEQVYRAFTILQNESYHH